MRTAGLGDADLAVLMAERRTLCHTRDLKVGQFASPSWFKECDHEDLLGTDGEHAIGETSTFEQTVDTILRTSELMCVPPLTPCPVRCPRCACKANTTS
jgi:hypothetical protein